MSDSNDAKLTPKYVTTTCHTVRLLYDTLISLEIQSTASDGLLFNPSFRCEPRVSLNVGGQLTAASLGASSSMTTESITSPLQSQLSFFIQLIDSN